MKHSLLSSGAILLAKVQNNSNFNHRIIATHATLCISLSMSGKRATSVSDPPSEDVKINGLGPNFKGLSRFRKFLASMYPIKSADSNYGTSMKNPQI